ncbi:lipopolysaccharide biosynthesis protein WzxC [Methyloglobulus morosus KoM1]|uniref:Lipopolysaccharide biosynthesis protein WzxC n=1 Tax=Methyloglobulus morosus KoM1 TaxID=1116472 RepID=V5BNP1_9GAMM|nr:lipopolysaccharide biosynthesis protein [Methyloglobulus morosus]ESS66173.1 lipopolysaccharide biosynthesis protein WzxC [Methyloglobulus morosus KoM1]
MATQVKLLNPIESIMKDLKEKIIRGSFAKIVSQAVNVFLRLGSLIVLARLLDPTDFGLVTMVTAVSGVFKILKDAGLSMATIQRDTVSHEQMSTLFWINTLLGLILALLLVAMAPAIVTFYNEPRLYWVTLALGVDFIFTGLTAQHSALLQRQMRFDTIAFIDIITLLAGIIVAVSMALDGWGYWALVGQAVITPCAYTICTWAAVRWIPGMPRRSVGIRSMLRFGGTITLNGLVMYFAYNVEKILLGRFWGADSVGIYERANQLIKFPIDILFSSIGGVMFSALSRIQDDPNRQKRYFLKGLSLVLTLSLPITFACAIFADDVIFVLLGPKWKDAAPIFRLLAPAILVLSMINPFYFMLLSFGLVKRSLKIAFVIAPLVIASYIIGLPHGPTGVAFAYSAAMILWVVPHIAWCIHGTRISVLDIVQTVSRPFISGIVASALAFGIQFYYGQFLSSFQRLALGSSVMLISYLWMLLFIMGQKTFYLDLFLVLKTRNPVDQKN